MYIKLKLSRGRCTCCLCFNCILDANVSGFGCEKLEVKCSLLEDFKPVPDGDSLTQSHKLRSQQQEWSNSEVHYKLDI